jgi:alpha-galactosidase
LPFTIVYPDVQVWLLGLLAPIWLAWLVNRGHFAGGRRWLKGPFFDEEPATPPEEPPQASLRLGNPRGPNGACSAIVLAMLLPASLLAGPGATRSEPSSARNHERLAPTGVPFLLCAKPEDESEYDDALWGNEQGTATGEGSRKTAETSVRPRLQLIPDVPGASATPLATAVSLPFTRVLSGPVTDYALLTASGEVEAEYLLETRRLPASGFRFVQKDGKSGSQLKPWLAVWNLKTGRGVMVLLAWSGNWVLEVAPRDGKTVLRADTSPSGLERFGGAGGLPFPGALVSEFTGHWDYGAQPIARFIRAKLLRNLGLDWPPVQYNTWYASEDQIGEKQLIESARVAADLGCELFTVDAGWYGHGPGRAWSQRLGDWEVDRERLPKGLGAVAAEVRRLGMKFGLWVEIECAAPLSRIGKEHPDWFLHDGKRRLSDRAVLDFGNPAALAWATRTLHDLVTGLRLDYLKMDFNATIPVDGERLAPDADPLYGHYRQLAGLWLGLRSAHPALILENCASGSLRQDAMTAALTDTHWISDNVDNLSSLAIVYGATVLFPPEICSHWTCYPAPGLNHYPGPGGPLALESQFTVNMMGHFGLSGRIWDWDARTRRVAAERILRYKRLRSILREADVFHLTPQANFKAPASVQALLYLQPRSNKGLLFAFQGGDPSNEARIRLRGLEPNRTYFVSWPEAFGPPRTIRGKELLEQGLVISFPYRGSSAIITIDPED